MSWIGFHHASLAGKTAWVSGAGRGIGAAIASGLVENGARVVIAEIDAEAGEQAAARLGAAALAVVCDAGSPEQVQASFDQAAKHFGPVNFVIHNAAASASGPIESVDWETLQRVVDVNLMGAVAAVRAAAPHWREGGGGSAVFISSTRALMSEPDGEAYAMTKAGLLGLTHALANSLGPHARVNAICPGWINTQGDTLADADHVQHAVGRVGIAEDIANLALYLCSDLAGFITGQHFVADGGMTRKMIYS